MGYREFLLAFLTTYLETNKVSHRRLAKLCGFASPNYVKLVCQGQRHLSPQRAVRVAESLPFSVAERRTFLKLYAEYWSTKGDTLWFGHLLDRVS